jgi:adenosylcobinamide-GDP ribazoletransferase
VTARPGGGPLADLLAAAAFLTRLPVSAAGEVDRAGMARAALWFPVVGAAVGALAGGVRLALDTVIPAGPATVLALVVAAAVTGALHEDALADTADALGAHVSRERRLEILRDPRVGAFGALALALAVVLAVVTLAPLDGGQAMRALVAAHLLARWATLPQALLLAPARGDGLGAGLRPGWVGVTALTVVCAAATLAVAGPGPGAVALATAAVVTVAWLALVRRAFGGQTGDTLGAGAKLVELAVPVALLAVWA